MDECPKCGTDVTVGWNTDKTLLCPTCKVSNMTGQYNVVYVHDYGVLTVTVEAKTKEEAEKKGLKALKDLVKFEKGWRFDGCEFLCW